MTALPDRVQQAAKSGHDLQHVTGGDAVQVWQCGTCGAMVLCEGDRVYGRATEATCDEWQTYWAAQS